MSRQGRMRARGRGAAEVDQTGDVRDTQKGNERLIGVVIVLKDTFGFIRSPSLDKNVYFSRPEALKIRAMDEVSFKYEVGPKGLLAIDLEVNLRCDDNPSNAEWQVNNNKPKEQGIIESIRGGSEFGFIMFADRNKNIYFRMSNINNRDDFPDAVHEGMEVEFNVVSESQRGGEVKDRAVNINLLPRGTVHIEMSLAIGVQGVVISSPRTIPQDEPGLLRLNGRLGIAELEKKFGIPKLNFHPALASADGKWLEKIELWPRCLPDGINLREGDEATVDVQNYRPDALIFARKLKIRAYRSLGRENGTIKVIKTESGYGFIRPRKREGDIYFRVSDVPVPPGVTLTPDIALSFDISTEHVGRGPGAATRFRAVRLELCQDSTDAARQLTMLHGLRGKVNRNSRNYVWSLRMDGTFCRRMGEQVARTSLTPADLKRALALEHNSKYAGSDLHQALRAFNDDADLKEAHLEHLLPSQVLEYQRCLEDSFPGVAYSSLSRNTGPDIAGVASTTTLKLRKLDMGDYKVWKEAQVNKRGTGSVFDFPTESERDGAQDNSTEDYKWMTSISFTKADCDETRGPLKPGVEVEFDLCVDVVSGRKVAKNVRMSLEPVDPVGDGYEDPSTGFNAGIIEIVKQGGTGMYGSIRRIPDDQKLFWHVSDLSKSDAAIVQAGFRALFKLGRKSGSRCAIDVQLIPFDAPTHDLPLSDLPWVEKILHGRCRAIAVSPDEIVVVDASACPFLDRITANLAQSIYEYESSEDERSLDWNRSMVRGEDDPTVPKESEPNYGAEQKDYSTPPVLETDAVNDTKHFSLLQSLPLRVPPLPDGPLVPGEIVTCQVVAHWAVQRNPVRAGDVQRKLRVQETRVLRLTGVTMKKKISVGRVSLVQIAVRPERPEGMRNMFYCDQREFAHTNISSSRNIGEVGFLGDESTGIAVSVTPTNPYMTQSMHTTADSSSYQRRPVNASLLESQVGKGLSHKERSIIAKRPSDETEIGFTPGWRPIPDIDELPWGGLLQHLS